VELGYLTSQRNLVVVESLGTRVLYKAYRVDESAERIDFLGFPRPLEFVSNVVATIYLQRDGWGAPGEVALRRTEMRLYRTKWSHILVGGTWRDLRLFHWRQDEVVSRPFLSGDRPIQQVRGISIPSWKAPAIVLFSDPSIKACRRRDLVVELFATETKELTDFVLGKLTARLEFPSEDAAKAFERHFPRAENPKLLDPSVRVEIERTRRVVWSRRVWRKLAPWLVSLTVPYFFLLAIFASVGGLAFGLGIGLIPLAGLFLVFYSRLPRYRKERVDLARKWPKTVLDRWYQDFRQHAAGFAFGLKEIGVTLDLNTSSLAPLDRFLRSLPPDTLMGSFALGAADLLATALLGSLRRNIRFEWRTTADQGLPCIFFESIDLFVTPVARIAKIWELKDPGTLDGFVKYWGEEARSRFAFSPLTEFISTGFLDRGWTDFQVFRERWSHDLESARTETRVIGESQFRRRRMTYGPFAIDFVELEALAPDGAEYLPLVAIPFCDLTQPLRITLEGAATKNPVREDIAVVRLAGNELVSLGIQVRNYLDVASSIRSVEGPLDIDAIAVCDRAQVVSPRMRQLRPETADFLAPFDATPEGVPTVPYATFLGRVDRVREVTNPFHGTEFWHVDLGMPSLSLQILVRKDGCDGVPEVGYHLSGTVWLVANVNIPEAETPRYIR
jgi:hypothetical protein